MTTVSGTEIPDAIRKGLIVFPQCIVIKTGDIGLYQFFDYGYVFIVIVPFV